MLSRLIKSINVRQRNGCLQKFDVLLKNQQLLKLEEKKQILDKNFENQQKILTVQNL